MSESLAPELTRRQTHTDAVARYFKAHLNQWILAVELEKVGGRQAWRTRVSECRKQRGMFIENKQERSVMADGTIFVQSSYRYLEHAPIGRSGEIQIEKAQPQALPFR